MAHFREDANHLEWRITASADDGISDDIQALSQPSSGWKPWLVLESFIKRSFSRIWKFFEKAWSVAVDDPKKVIHCLKVGFALTVVSLFYYMRPLYDGVGGTAMWAVLTVVVAFEYYVGATLAKSLNRVTGTFLAGFLAVGVHWVASQFGGDIEPIISDISVFLLGSLATFSRFIPTVKARFDYGAMVFVLTFTLISVSGYRVEKLFEMARERLLTIVIGTCFCILISMLVVPAWAGDQLHALITLNMDKLAKSLECCITKYCDNLDETITTKSDNYSAKDVLAYRCVLNTKASEESLANFARWEPGHGSFKFQHPWKQYLKIGAAMRSFAYCIEALNSCDENQDSGHMMNTIGKIYFNLSSSSSGILRELARSIKTMTKSSKMDVLVEQMNYSVEELRDFLNHVPGFSNTETERKCLENEQNKASQNVVSLLEVIPIVSYASLLIEIASRIEDIIFVVQELAHMAEFKTEDDDNKATQNQH
ncbi:hypothetical protein Leryth_023142 [Lithospermum erythrorhizon]|uniref:Aluminum-activated malate transporter n=1 Tax=Lithospermum erythrorhizon TaxID=34254 RepID=A0AAV3Q586_LITER|nr:hypothetical protein Leryth_023142 [Lithospermum erythrorhizon]